MDMRRQDLRAIASYIRLEPYGNNLQAIVVKREWNRRQLPSILLV